MRPFVSADQNALIENELKFQRERRQTRLPNGAIHADLFRDNVLFDGMNLSGLIDFGFAATDEFAYDLAGYRQRLVRVPAASLTTPVARATGCVRQNAR